MRVIKAESLISPKRIEIIERPIPILDDGEALVRVRATGLCGTDFLVYTGDLKSTILPITNGHEAAGIIEHIIGETNGFAIGDRVFFRGSWGCGHCSYCKIGKAQLCKRRKMLGVDMHGTLAEYVSIPTSQLFHLSDNISFSNAQSIVSISCAINLTRSINIRLGMNAVIFGPGHNGLIILQLLKRLGFDRVAVVVGHRINRTKLAMVLGADATIVYDDPELAKKVNALIPDGPDIVVEASGSTNALNQSIKLVRHGGTILVFSIYNNEMNNFNCRELYNKNITIIGIKGAGNYYQDAERFLHKGIVKIAPLITHRFSLEESAQAFAKFHDIDAVRIIVEN